MDSLSNILHKQNIPALYKEENQAKLHIKVQHMLLYMIKSPTLSVYHPSITPMPGMPYTSPLWHGIYTITVWSPALDYLENDAV